MMVENGSAFVESSRVPRIAELEQVVVEVVTELVAERTQKCPKRCDFLLSRSSHPQPYEHRRGSSQWTGHADMATVMRYLSPAELPDTQSKINSIAWGD
jgi:hypothetical protein